MRNAVSLLTGAGGFIGAHLAQRLVAAGDRVHVIVRPSTSLARLAPFVDRLVVHRIDLADRAEIRRCLAGIRPRRVFHLAAETRLPAQPSFAAARAAAGTYLQPALNLLEPLAELAEPPDVVVRAGTIAEYGRAELPYSETRRAFPTTPYGAGMLATTDSIAMLAPLMPFPVVTARLALCYGPGQATSFLIPALVEACLANRPITVQRPLDRRDLLHVDDAVDALLHIARMAPRDFGTVNICTGIAPTMAQVAQRIAALAGCAPGIVTLRPAQSTEPGSGGQPTELRSDPARARSRLRWEPLIGFEEGLRRTVAAHRQLQQQHIQMKAG